MGVVNVTPDSFSDGGAWLDAAAAIAHGRELVAQGAAILDIGGESTRPGAEPVSEAEELRRVVPVLEGLAGAGARLSIDTSKAAVAAAALDAGATIVNDVTALRGDPAMAALVAERGCDVCLMHMLGEPRTMQRDPRYDDVVADVQGLPRRAAARSRSRRGSREERVWLDPGIGFGKTIDHNLALLARLDELVALGRPLVVGTSRKSFLGTITGRDPQRPRGGRRSRRTSSRSPAARASSASTTSPRRAMPCSSRLLRCAGDGLRDDDPDDEALDDDDFDDDEDRIQTVVTVEVNGLSLYTHHGVTAAEREVGQRLILDIRLELGEADATVTDRLEDTVDYGARLRGRGARRDAALRQDARAPLRRDRRPPAQGLRRAGRVGQGRQARAADPARRRRRLGRGLARARRARRLTSERPRELARASCGTACSSTSTRRSARTSTRRKLGQQPGSVGARVRLDRAQLEAADALVVVVDREVAGRERRALRPPPDRRRLRIGEERLLHGDAAARVGPEAHDLRLHAARRRARAQLEGQLAGVAVAVGVDELGEARRSPSRARA